MPHGAQDAPRLRGHWPQNRARRHLVLPGQRHRATTPLVKLFASVLRREKDGRYYLVTPAEKALVHVEDAPFLAVAMEVKGSGKRQRLTFRTNLDEMVEAGLEHPLSFRTEKSGSFTPFVLVRDGLQARLTRPVYYELVAAAATETKDGKRRWGCGAATLFSVSELPPPGKD